MSNRFYIIPFGAIVYVPSRYLYRQKIDLLELLQLLEPQQRRIIATAPPKESLTAIPVTPVGPCSICAEQIMCDANIAELQLPRTLHEIKEKMYKENFDEGFLMHYYSECNLTKIQGSRRAAASKPACMQFK